MSVLYDLIPGDVLINLPIEKKIEFLSEIITEGNFEYFNKFKSILPDEITKYIDADKMLSLIPIDMDVDFFEYVIHAYEYKQGRHFFYNYALYSLNGEIKRIVYKYFVDNFSDVMFDNMDMYEALIEK